MAEKPVVAIIDDESDMRNSIAQWMGLSGFRAETHESGEAALKALSMDFPGVVISDIRMPGIDGMQLLRRLQSIDPSLPVIMITGHGDVTMAVEAMRMGAYDFVEKPFDPERLADLARRASHARRLTLDNRRLRRELADGTLLLHRLVGSSQVIEQLRDSILDIAQSDGNVLVWGETGTGKSLIAHALHACGPRRGKAFVVINCAAHGEEALEAAIFGPPASPDQRPAIERADGGALLLEDVESLPPALQARLLSELAREDEVEAIDAVRSVRVIAISTQITDIHTPPQGLREDLFFRLAAHHIATPPLRERGEDILMLFNRFCARFAEDYGCEPPEISAEDAALLIQYRWPGNIRQLINIAERAVLQKRRGEAGIDNLIPQDEPMVALPGAATGKPLKDHVEAFEKMLIDNALRRNRGAVSAVMDELQLPRRTLNEKMAKYGLSRGEYL